MLIALDMRMTLEGAGFKDLVVCNSLAEATAYVDTATPRLAFLDVNLGDGETSLAVGAKLATRGCEVVILSGYTGSTVQIPAELKDATRLSKPFAEHELVALAEKAFS